MFHQYQSPMEDMTTALVIFFFIPSRPLGWAADSDFDANSDDNNMVSVVLELENDRHREMYEDFVQWVAINQNSRSAVAISKQDAETWIRHREE
jgi:hypothetical protein